MGIARTGGQRTATSQTVEDGRTLSRLRNHYRGSTALSNRALFWGAPLIGAALLSAVPAVGNPTGGSVVGGSATISGDGTGNVTINQTTDRAILHWDDFSIDVGETTQFVQPGAGSIALNRVTGTAESILLGTLTANGNVWLVNPNGVFAGAGSVIDVNGFLGSTADILDSDFLDGNDRFSFDIPSANPDASVVNYGGISVGERGLAALVAPGVENDGIIVGRMAQVVLGGTSTFALDFTGDGLLSFEVGSQVAAAPDGMTELVTNSGQIDAPGGMVLLTASTVDGVVDNVINMTGVIQARSLTTANGQVVLSGGDSGVVRMAGTIDTSGNETGETGGTVKLLGESVALDLGALVDASGDAGGGTVLVGGNFQGNGPEQNATQSFVGADATIHADALTSGDGGTVIVWADDYTQFEGAVTARGGANGGDGGFVEVSGAETLSFAGAVDTRAPAGSVGTLLLDPITLDVVSGAAGVGEIQDTVLSGNLGTTDVTLQTTVGGDGTGDGEITFVTGASVVWTSGNDLTVIAEDNLGGNIQNGTVSVEAGVTINGTDASAVDVANLEIQAGTVDLASDIFVDGTISGTATAVSVSPGASIQDGIDVAALLGATVTVNAGTYAESVTIAKPLDLDLSGTVQVTDLSATEAIGLGGTLNTDGGALSFSQDVTLTADTILDTDQTGAVAAGTVTFAGIESAFSLSIDTTGAVDDGAIGLGDVGQTAALDSLDVAGGVTTLNGDIATDGGNVDFTAASAVVLASDVAIDTDAASQPANQDAGAVLFGSTPVNGGFELAIDATQNNTGTSANGAVTLGDVGPSEALAALSASGGTLTLNGGITTADGDVILRSGSDLTIASPIDTQPGLGVAVSTIDIAIDPGVDPNAANPPELANTAAGTLNSDAVTLTADAMDLSGTVTATGAVTLAQSTIGRQINLAGEVSGRLSLTDAEIDQIDDASILRIGNTDAGRINFSNDLTPATDVTVVALISGADVVDSNNAGLIVEDLRITSAGVELDSGNHDVTNLAAEVTGDGNDFIYLNEIGGFTVASVDGVDGISTADATSDSGDITLSSAGTINIDAAIVTGNDTVAATDGVDAALTGSITVTSTGGAIIGDGSGTLTTGAAQVGGNDAVAVADTATSGSITLTADGVIELAATDALATGNATVTSADLNDTATTGSIILSGDTVTDGAGGLVSVAMGSAIANPDGAAVAGVLTATTDGAGGGVLDSAILVTSAVDLTLGGLTSIDGTIVAVSTGGDIDATGAIDAGAANVTLRAQAGAVTQDPASTITAEGLAIAADSASLVDDANDINVLAADIGGTNEAFRYTQTNGLEIGTVTDGLSGSEAGITTQGGLITIIADTGVLDLVDGVTSNDGGISLAGEGVTQSASSTVSAGTGTITIDADAGVIDMAGLLTTTSTDVVTGAVRIVDGGLTTLGNISAVNGLVVLGDAVDGTLGAIGQSDLPTPATIIASELAIAGSDTITLDHANEIGTLNAVTRGGAFTLNDSTNGMTIAGVVGDGAGTVDIETAGGVLAVNSGITATNNTVILSGDGVNFGVDGDVNSGSGTISVDGRAGIISTNFVGLDGTELLSTGTINLVADDMIFAAGSVIGGNGLGGLAATVIATPSSSGAADDTIGLAGGVGTLQLDLTDLNAINATDVRIGDTTVTDGIDIGNQLIDGALAATFSPGVLTLASNGGITGSSVIDLANGAVDRDLILRSAGDVVLDNAGNDFNNIAADIGGALTLDNSDALIVTTLTDDIGPVAGVTAANGVQIDSGGLLTVATGGVATTNVVSGDIDLTARNGGLAIDAAVDSAGGSVDISALGTGGITNTSAIAGAVNVALDTVDGDIAVNETVNATNGAVNIAANGIGRTLTSTGAGTITGDGDVTLTTSSGNVTVGGAVDSVAGAVSVTANGAGSTLQNTASITAENAIGLTATAGNVAIDGLVDSDAGPITVAANGTAATLSNTAAIIADGNVTLSTTDGVVSIGGAVESESGTVDITANGIGRTLTSTGAGTITGNGDVTLATADGDLSLGGAVDSTTGAVSATANGAGRTLSNTAAITAQTDITLSATAGNVTIDGLVDSDGGTVDVTANGTAATLSNTAAIIADGNVTLSTSDGLVSIGEAVESETGTVDITANGIGRTLTSTGAGTITGNGDVTLATANGDLTIGGAVDSTTGAVSATANGAGRTLSNTAAITAQTDITLSATAGNVTIDGLVDSDGGTVDVTANGTAATLSNTAAIIANGNVTLSTTDGVVSIGGAVESETGTVDITANGIGRTLTSTGAGTITGDGNVTLATADGNLTIGGTVDSSAGDVDIQANGAGRTLTANAAVTADDNVTMATASGNLAVNAAVGATNGSADITAGGVGTTLSLGTDGMVTADSTVALTADEMSLGDPDPAGGNNSITGTVVTLETTTAGRAIDLGEDPDLSLTALHLSDTELDTVSADVLRIGAADAGPIYVTDAITLDPASVPVLSLETNSAVLRWATNDGDTIAVNGLAIDANSFVFLDTENDVDTLAVDTPSILRFDDADGFDVVTVDTVSGLTSGGSMTLVSEGGTIDVAGSIDVVSGGTMLIDTGVDSGSGDGGTFITGTNSSVEATSGDLTVIADIVDLGGTLTASAAGASVAIANASADRAIGIGGAIAGLDLNLAELSRITADTVTVGSSDAGAMVIAGLDPASTDTFNTLELITGEGMQFDGDLNGSFNLTMTAGGDIDFGDLADPNSTVSFGTEAAPLGVMTFTTPGNVELGGSAVAGVQYFAEEFVIDIGGSFVSGQLNPTATTFQPVNLERLTVLGAGSITLFGSIAGDATQTAASQGPPAVNTPNGKDADWLFNGCVLNTLTCFNVPLILPIAGLDLSLEEERLLREPFEEEEEELEDLLSNTGNEELW